MSWTIQPSRVVAAARSEAGRALAIPHGVGRGVDRRFYTDPVGRGAIQDGRRLRLADEPEPGGVVRAEIRLLTA